MRYAGIPLPADIINNNLLISTLVLISMVMLLLLRERQSLFISSLQSVFSNEIFFAGKITFGDQLQQNLLLVLSLVGISFFSASTLYAHPSWSNIGLILAGLILFFLLKIGIMQAYFRLFFGKRIQEFMYKYTSLTIVFGISCFIAFLLQLYAPLVPQLLLHSFLVFMLVIYSLSVTYILFRHFFNRPCLIFHFILYLCTLEILPILILLKWAI